MGTRFTEVTRVLLASRYRMTAVTLSAWLSRESGVEVVASASVDGSWTKVIAATLGVSTRTVDNHRAHVMRKLRVRNTTELARFATSAVLVSL